MTTCVICHTPMPGHWQDYPEYPVLHAAVQAD